VTIAIVGTTSVSGSSSSLSVPVPSGIEQGDLILLCAAVDFDGLFASNVNIVTPPGFSSVPDASIWFRTSNRSRIALFWKTASAGESGNYNFSFSGNGSFLSWSAKAICRVFRKHNLPLGASANDTDGSGLATSLTAPSVNSNSNGLLVCLWGVGGGSALAIGWPSGMTDVLEVDPGGGNAGLMIAQKLIISAGPTGVKTLTISESRPWAAVSLVIDSGGGLFPLWENF
jgi:hypothetical protein